jgi:hypothetical protein
MLRLGQCATGGAMVPSSFFILESRGIL